MGGLVRRPCSVNTTRIHIVYGQLPKRKYMKIFNHGHFPPGKWKKIIILMNLKLAVLLCCVGTISAAPSFSQDKRLDVDYRNASVTSVLEDLKARTGYRFLYFMDIIPADAAVTMSKKDATVAEVLNTALDAHGLKYSFDNDVIVISRSQSPRQLVQATPPVVEGRVTDVTGTPLVGATVQVAGTMNATSTDTDGRYRLTISGSGETELVFSFIGMGTQSVRYTGQSAVNVIMTEEASEVDEVVVTGYATFRKSGFTGSFTTVKREDLLKVSSTNVLQALQVFDPSLRIVANNEMGSDPNTMPELYIRGESGIGVTDLDKIDAAGVSEFALKTNPNLPVFMLDGHEVDVQKIVDMDPYRINTITILKDAAATAMYGSRASNGIVVIETVAPEPGRIQVSYNMNGQFVVPDLSGYDLMKAREKVDLEYRMSTASTGGNNAYSNLEEYHKKMNAVLRGVDTYWLSQPLRTAFTHNHNVNIEGGEGSSRFALGLNLGENNGAMKGSFRRTMGATFRMDFRIKGLLITNNLDFGTMNSQDSPYGAFSQYVDMQPYWAPRDPDTGVLNRQFFVTTDIFRDRAVENPLYEATLDSYNRNGYWNLTDNLTVQAFVGDFQIRMRLGVSYRNSDSRNFLDPESGRNPFGLPAGSLRIGEQETLDVNMNMFVNYNRSLGDHNINANLGVDIGQSGYNAETTSYRGFPSAQFDKPKYAKELASAPSLSDSRSRLAGLVFTGNYTFRNTYLFDASFRVDGSSQFGSKNRFAPFWSLGAGVNVHNYEWFKRQNVVDMLKVRANIGQTGRVGFPPTAAVDTYTMLMDDPGSTGYGAVLASMGNERLTWDKQWSTNIGFDVTMWQRLSLNFSWYDKRTRNQVTQISLPSSSGFTSYTENMGDVLNRGFEVAVSWAAVRSKDFDLNLSVNAAHNNNRILKISDALKEYNDRVDEYYAGYNGMGYYSANDDQSQKYITPVKKYEEGGSITSIYGVKSLGIAPANGNELYMRRDGTVTYVWNSADQVIIGDSRPDLQGGFTLAMRYKAVSLFASFMYEYGGDIYNETLIRRVESVRLLMTNADRRVLTGAWQKEGDMAHYKRVEGYANLETLPTSRFVQKNNTLKFNSLSVRYEFDRGLAAKIGLGRLSIQANMNDVATLSTVKQERGTSYPFARNFGFAINAGF